MPEICALVDYDNQRQGVFRSGRPGAIVASYRDHEEYIRALIAGLLTFRKHPEHRLFGAFAELRIRLYGGWLTSDGAYTEMADMVLKAISNIGASQRSSDTRVFLELADRLLTMSDEAFSGTMRKTPWPGARLEFRNLSGPCRHGAPCSNVMSGLLWASGRCPDRATCSERTENVFLVQTQKLVDTMIASDAFLAHHLKADEILAVSMDDDIVPCALAVSSMGGPISVLRFGRVNVGLYDRMLRQHGVPLIDMPSLG